MLFLLAEGKISSLMAVRRPGVIALFDVDGTLTAPRKVKKNMFPDVSWSVGWWMLSYQYSVIVIWYFVPYCLCGVSFWRKIFVKFQGATPQMFKFMEELRKVSDLLQWKETSMQNIFLLSSFSFSPCKLEIYWSFLIFINTTGCYSWCCGRIWPFKDLRTAWKFR